MITLTTNAENVDTETLGEFTDFLIQGEVDGLFPIGTTGEDVRESRTGPATARRRDRRRSLG
jgi:dihydrodipicolinate synthase/N-acetylneuraminate lyase